MTWQSFFDFSTLDHRHILAAYATILLVNTAVLARLLYSWFNPKL